MTATPSYPPSSIVLVLLLFHLTANDRDDNDDDDNDDPTFNHDFHNLSKTTTHPLNSYEDLNILSRKIRYTFFTRRVAL